VGLLVVAGALRRILEAGIRDVYLLTETAERFFDACGFRTIDREELPEAVATHPQAVRECSTMAVAMTLRLPSLQSS
jgi:amino-acid N-acetyltransferase